MRSGPSASRNNCFAFCSLRAEHSASKRFSMNSVSSVSKGSLLRNCYNKKSTTKHDDLKLIFEIKITDNTLRMISMPSFSLSTSRFSFRFCSKIERSSAAYARFSSWDLAWIRFKSQAMMWVWVTNVEERPGLDPIMFSKIPIVGHSEVLNSLLLWNYLECEKFLVYLILQTPSDAKDYQPIIQGQNFWPTTCFKWSFQPIRIAHQALDQNFQRLLNGLVVFVLVLHIRIFVGEFIYELDHVNYDVHIFMSEESHKRSKHTRSHKLRICQSGGLR